MRAAPPLAHRMHTKIALVGAHGVGKTTLLEAVGAHLQTESVLNRLMPEIPRMICDAVGDPAFFRRGKNTLLKQMAIIIGQLVVEHQPPNASGLLLCDRTVVDHWAYTRTLFRSELDALPVVIAYEDMLRRHCSSYDRVFYIPIEFAPKDDGTRESDPVFQQEIDSEILRLLSSWGMPFISISGSVEARMGVMLKHLADLGLRQSSGV